MDVGHKYGARPTTNKPKEIFMDNIFGKLLPFFILTIFIIAMAPGMRRAYIKMHSSGNDRQKKCTMVLGSLLV
jgi:hypothetical protein